MNISKLEKLTAAARFDRIYREKVDLEEAIRKSNSLKRVRQFKFQEAEQYVMESIFNHSIQ
ncbi:MAG: hypothetical protein CMM49_06370 [Rhodospirillaceae bacterium]|nr:hypothetical protein [Rhodospirillaceae bacterium]|tara:strand:- start:663 stop:845 length:183 start_codon:yes stop_codon:yes gene_type:complete